VNNKLFMYDFEVFKKLWLVVFIDYNTKEKTIIINDVEKLKIFYELHKEDIFVGFNSRMYDQFIFKGLLDGLNPYSISNEIIQNNNSGYRIVENHESYQLYNFDISSKFYSLKQLEAFMGSRIEEVNIPFDTNRKLNKSKTQEVVKYCTHDVEETIKVFNYQREEFDGQLSLIKAFNLPMTMFNKTKPQLAAYILGAERKSRDDEFDISIPDTLNISEKYQYIVDWYKNPVNRDYKRGLYTDVANIPHVFKWGGLHGAISNYKTEGILLYCDVSSLYPAIMIEYNYLSRNVKNPEKYKEIRDTRLKLKKKEDPREAPLKIVLNSTYGAMKDKYNDLYDPLMANNVCVAGQLLLLDLIDKTEQYCNLIQSNTDGLFLKVDNMDTVEKIKEIAKEWEQRTRLDLEWDIYSKIYQKDVNNYIIVNKEGKYKSKGAYVKKLSAINYDMSIVNKALVNYFIKNQSIEKTIEECNDLIEYQKVVKISNLYMYGLYGDKKLKEKVLRVFASNKENAAGVFKVKSEDRIEKIANTPEKCFINNSNIIGTKIPEELDKQYYINLSKKRLDDFLTKKPTKKTDKIDTGIKFVNHESLETIKKLNFDNFILFTDLLVYLKENTNINKTNIEVLIGLNYFKFFGGNKKLLNITEKFIKKYKTTYKEKTKLNRITEIKEYELSLKDETFSMLEQFKFEQEYLGYIQTCTHKKEDRKRVFVLNISKKYSPKLELYNIGTGRTGTMKVRERDFKNNPFDARDILTILRYEKKFKLLYKGRDKKNKPMFEPSTTEIELWITDYIVEKLL
jgi:hypothetical protein